MTALDLILVCEDVSCYSELSSSLVSKHLSRASRLSVSSSGDRQSSGSSFRMTSATGGLLCHLALASRLTALALLRDLDAMSGGFHIS